MFEGHSADTRAGKFPLVPMGGRAEGLACADPGGRTPIGVSGNFLILISPGVVVWCGGFLTDNNTTPTKVFKVVLGCWLGCGNLA